MYTIEDLIAALTKNTQSGTPTGVGTSSLPATGLNYLLNMNPAFGYTSPGTITSALNPEMLIASGLFNPTTAAEMQQSILERQQGEWMSKLAPYLKELTPPTDIVRTMELTNPYYAANPDVADILTKSIFPSIIGGTATPEGVKTKMIDAFASGELGDLSMTDQDFILSEIDRFGAQLPKYLQDVQDFTTKQATQQSDAEAQLAAMGQSKPDLRSAQMEWYKYLGMPQLALLPDVTEQYKFSGLDFLKEAGVRPEGVTEGLKALENIQAKLSSMPAATPAATPGVSDADMRKQYYGSRMIYEQAAPVEADYIKEQRGKLKTFKEWQAEGNKGDYQKYVNRYRVPAMKGIEATARYLGNKAMAQQPAGAVAPKPGVYVPSVKTDESNKLQGVSQAIANLLKAAEKRGQAKADELSGALTKAGVTPLQQMLLSLQLPDKKK